jgi:hypothetical protein
MTIFSPTRMDYQSGAIYEKLGGVIDGRLDRRTMTIT